MKDLKICKDLSTYLSGEKLYGDDFTINEIKNWFKDEKEGYANLGAKEKYQYRYAYHQLNKYHGYRFLNKRKFQKVLGIGSAYGDEFKPIVNQIDEITIIEPSDAFSGLHDIQGIPCKYIKPNVDGNMPFEDNTFDLITCFGVMHHIPNVSYVINELFRCLNGDGIMLLREPIVSMGDWTKSRARLTKRERGIPLQIFEEIIINAGFRIKQKSLCIFPAIPNITKKFGIAAYNSRILTFMDYILSQSFAWNIKYHRTTIFEKLCPVSVFFVLTK